MAIDETERLRRWRRVLGAEAAAPLGVELSGESLGMDRVLGALYDGERSAGLGSSSPNVTRWLGDIRTYFPSTTVRVMQQDALERLNLRQMLLQPEMLEAVDADVHLVATLLSLSRVIPERTKETARGVVRKVVDELLRKLQNRTVQAVRGSLNRDTRTNRPRANEIKWDRTNRANMKNYLPERGTIIAVRLECDVRNRTTQRDNDVCVVINVSNRY